MQKSFLTNEGKKAEMKVVCNKWVLGLSIFQVA